MHGRSARGALAAVLLLALATSGSGALGPVYGGHITVELAELPARFDPAPARGAGARLIAALVHERLVDLGEGGPRPALAESWETGASGRECSFRLRDSQCCILPRMARPIWITGLSRRMPVARASSKILRAVLLDLLDNFPSARGNDSHKGIHDLRVAVKRFREAFRLFRPVLRKKLFRKHREWIENLNDALGEVRDRDVALIQLRNLTAGHPEPPLGVDGLISRLESERLRAADALATVLDRLQLEGVAVQLAASIETIEQDTASLQPTYSFACERVHERLLDVRARSTAARLRATPESMHSMRIGNKRLRYAIEPFSRMLGKEVRQDARQGAETQRRRHTDPERTAEIAGKVQHALAGRPQSGQDIGAAIV